MKVILHKTLHRSVGISGVIIYQSIYYDVVSVSADVDDKNYIILRDENGHTSKKDMSNITKILMMPEDYNVGED